MAHPAEVMLKDGNFDAGKRRPKEDLVGGDTFPPIDAKYTSVLRLLESLQMFNVPKNTRFTSRKHTKRCRGPITRRPGLWLLW